MERSLDTIVAAASGWTHSARGLVRMSGPATRDVLAGVLVAPVKWERAATTARVRLASDSVLPAVLLLAPGPASFTGEDSAEILTVGNPVVLGRVVDALLAAGAGAARTATPGEFSARAYMNGRLSVEQAEGLAASIAARTHDDLAAARSLMGGATGVRYRAWSDEAATLLALVEAGIDFTDQEGVVAIAPGELLRRCALVRAQIAGELGGVAGLFRTGEPVCVLVGPPNAGKSTLFNALLGRRRAAVSPVAGTTRDVLRERLDLTAPVGGAAAGPLSVMLVDLAGLDESLTDPTSVTDALAQRAAREALAGADVIIACDPDARFDVLEVPSRPTGARVIRVRTKSDRTPAPPARAPDVIDVCAIDGRGLSDLRRAIADAAWGVGKVGGVVGGAAGSALASVLPRHRRALALAGEALDDAIAQGAGPSAELTAGALRRALDALGELTGRLSPDDVIGRIFATFCIGK